MILSYNIQTIIKWWLIASCIVYIYVAKCLALSDLMSLPWETESFKSIKSHKVRHKVKADEKVIHGLTYFKTEQWQK